MITIKDLIQELTDATEGSSELDYRIACAINYTFRGGSIGCADFAELYGHEETERLLRHSLPFWTTSLSQALSLIPTYETDDGPQQMDFILEHVNGGLTISAIVGSKNDEDRQFGSTDALAICIAALYARSRP